MANLDRRRTLYRPERNVGPAPMLSGADERKTMDVWVLFSRIVTFWAPGMLLSTCGMHDKAVQQAWREKFALCFIIAILCAIVAFLTLALPTTLCPSNVGNSRADVSWGSDNDDSGHRVGLYGLAYGTSGATDPPSVTLSSLPQGTDITYMFQHSARPSVCSNAALSKFAAVTFDHCQVNTKLAGQCTQAVDKDGIAALGLGVPDKREIIGYSWKDLEKSELRDYFVYNGIVLNLAPYLTGTPNPIPNDRVDYAIRQLTNSKIKGNSKDGTLTFNVNSDLKNAANCLAIKYKAGIVDKETVGCFASRFFLIVSLTVVLGIVMARFVMAITFDWFISHRLSKTPKQSPGSGAAGALKAGAVGQHAMQAAPWAAHGGSNADNGPVGLGPLMKKVPDTSTELYTVLLVTCYSEGEASLRCTIESLAETEYGDDHKLLFIIADGIITGSGEDRSTPDICADMIEIDPEFADPQPQSYIAIASGAKQHNMAKVYAGHFVHKGHRVPTVLVVKCGTPAEQSAPKPGNRGKRDSQIILMNFFSRVTYNERMCPLDYDLFRKVTHLMGITPDFFEMVLMVDADTKVYPDSLRLLINCVQNDPMVMGLCGETKIANKRQSWVTGIQVFEYYISHHLGKAFESVFGGVTCLPGCFCMYRLKARKGPDDWVPIITKPEIVQEYSSNVVETLHQKNLLLLGEDRFLTTLMLRNFPNRKMMFVPQAVCKTVVPDEFKVLLSQRRRWINSTVHNLLELVLVRNLCGIFCFSMQFVIFMELIGTVVLPVAIFMTYYLIISMASAELSTFTSYLPLIMLLAVLGLPGVLILITTRKVVYCAWMIVYLIALPVWNFVLPVYAYWHFDDFSWGETRKVAGEAKGDDHGKKEGDFDASSVPLKRWEDYERRRLREVKRAEQSMMHSHPYQASSPPMTHQDLGHEQAYYDYDRPGGGMLNNAPSQHEYYQQQQQQHSQQHSQQQQQHYTQQSTSHYYQSGGKEYAQHQHQAHYQ
ncbi:chitin synthase-domain-containing protein [Thamnocephalis sphaerospora]|uniref:chitin synthase n=1 Tax=Thamnocephalis sphaerospora TaxID=78915 RepID=A0A4P9XLK9_9FUNG|nr:chitin synthase-domain-containing protein [Thamnocephalis sphaerospora]|eukprot:RKP06753.1 chitin synthase-domain-containing protein [Thamnocephalis sphaerospora]